MNHFIKLTARYGAEEVVDDYEDGVSPTSTTTVCHFVQRASRLRSVRTRTFASPDAPGLLTVEAVFVDSRPIGFGNVGDDGRLLSEPMADYLLQPGQGVSVVVANYNVGFALSCEIEVELEVVGNG